MQFNSSLDGGAVALPQNVKKIKKTISMYYENYWKYKFLSRTETET